MNLVGIAHLASAVFLSTLVGFIISLNENDEPKRVLRETVRRASKLLGGLALAGLLVMVLTWIG